MGLSGFTNIHFAFPGAIAELAFGLLLVLGISIRFTGLAIGAVFTLSSMIFGIEELVRHLPIMTIALLLLLHGNRGNLLVFLSSLKLEVLPCQFNRSVPGKMINSLVMQKHHKTVDFILLNCC